MLLSTQTEIVKDPSHRKRIEIIKNAGFDAYDISLFGLKDDEGFEFNDNYSKVARDLRSYADEIGIVCNQAHAPFPSSYGDDKRDAEAFEKIINILVIDNMAFKIIVKYVVNAKTFPANNSPLLTR